MEDIVIAGPWIALHLLSLILYNGNVKMPCKGTMLQTQSPSESSFVLESMFLSRIADLISTVAPVTSWHFHVVSRWGLIPIPWITTRLTSKRHGLCWGFVRVTAWGSHTTYFDETWKITYDKLTAVYTRSMVFLQLTLIIYCSENY